MDINIGATVKNRNDFYSFEQMTALQKEAGIYPVIQRGNSVTAHDGF